MKIVILTLTIAVLIISCEGRKNTVVRYKTPSTSEKMILPFIGKKWFETRMLFSGTGTPHRNVEIKENGDVFFSFVQISPGMDKDEEITEIFFAGKYKKFMTCSFKKLNERIFYEITKDTIYEVDSKNNRIKSVDCADNDDDSDGGNIPTCRSILSDHPVGGG